MGAYGGGSKVWVLTLGVLEVNPEVDSIRAQRGRAQSANTRAKCSFQSSVLKLPIKNPKMKVSSTLFITVNMAFSSVLMILK